MSQLVFLLEEPSMESFLITLLPKLIPNDIPYKLITHRGKQDLEKSIPKKVRVSSWKPEPIFVIVRDQDSGDCKKIKEKLIELCDNKNGYKHCVRIVCRELESWYLGDLKAVSKAYNMDKLSKLQEKQKFRDPDKLNNASAELEILVSDSRKVERARKIASFINLENNRSHSFNVFIEGIKKVVDSFNNI